MSTGPSSPAANRAPPAHAHACKRTPESSVSASAVEEAPGAHPWADRDVCACACTVSSCEHQRPRQPDSDLREQIWATAAPQPACRRARGGKRAEGVRRVAPPSSWADAPSGRPIGRVAGLRGGLRWHSPLTLAAAGCSRRLYSASPSGRCAPTHRRFPAKFAAPPRGCPRASSPWHRAAPCATGDARSIGWYTRRRRRARAAQEASAAQVAPSSQQMNLTCPALWRHLAGSNALEGLAML